MSNQSKGEAIRLTNKTARNLREQAKQQRSALYALATVLSVLLAAVAVIIGIEHLIAVPLIVLLAIALDALIILLARGRYLSLTGQAICTEAAARQLRGDSSEQQRMMLAKRDLERIKQDLAMGDQAEEDDEDLYSPASVCKKAQKPQMAQMKGQEQDTLAVSVPQRRRRQARLQVLSNEPDDRAN